MILEAPPPPPIIDMCEVEEKKEEIEENCADTSLNESLIDHIKTPNVSLPHQTTFPNQSIIQHNHLQSRRVSAGTPVSLRKNKGEGVRKAPELSNFAKDIIPFHV